MTRLIGVFIAIVVLLVSSCNERPKEINGNSDELTHDLIKQVITEDLCQKITLGEQPILVYDSLNRFVIEINLSFEYTDMGWSNFLIKKIQSALQSNTSIEKPCFLILNFNIAGDDNKALAEFNIGSDALSRFQREFLTFLVCDLIPSDYQQVDYVMSHLSNENNQKIEYEIGFYGFLLDALHNSGFSKEQMNLLNEIRLVLKQHNQDTSFLEGLNEFSADLDELIQEIDE